MSALRLCVARVSAEAVAVSAARTAPATKPLLAVRTICHKDHMDPEVLKHKSKPWPWETKRYSWFHQNVLKNDKCVYRWDENTKVICIEGNVASGKSTFAAALADQLGMKHIKEPTFDDLYIDRNGFDYRTLNWRLPEIGHASDWRHFYENPKNKSWPITCVYIYRQRYHAYHRALAHLFSTGQGVVIERSPWTDIIFHEVNYKLGWVDRDFKNWMWKLRNCTENNLLRPHLVIHLDVTPEECLRRIKKRALDYESSKDNKVLKDTKWLEAMDNAYKNMHLPWISQHAELIVYDWNRFGDIDLVIEDLERLDFEQYEKRGQKMEDWRLTMSVDYDELRRKYCSWFTTMYKDFNQPMYDIKALDIPQEVQKVIEYVYDHHGPEYHPMYDPEKLGYLNVMMRGEGNYIESKEQYLWEPYLK